MKNESQNKQIEVSQPAIVMPSVSPDEAVTAWNAYLALKRKILTPDDVQLIQGKEFYKKSYWRKIATFFNLSLEITEQREEKIGDTNTVYHFTQKAIAPNGRYAYGVGSCDLMEKGRRNTIHNARGTAETRAFNRAVSNLVGGGEVSAEEIDESHEQVHPSPAPVKQEEQPIITVPVKKEPVMITASQKMKIMRLMSQRLNERGERLTLDDLDNAVSRFGYAESYQDLKAADADILIAKMESLAKVEDESEKIADDYDKYKRSVN